MGVEERVKTKDEGKKKERKKTYISSEHKIIISPYIINSILRKKLDYKIFIKCLV